VRHNGTAGEAGTFSDGGQSASGARLVWADPYVYITYAKEVASGSRKVARCTFDTWPPTLTDTVFSSSGTPRLISGVFKEGGVYYGMGGNFAGGVTPYAAVSYDGVEFFSRYSMVGVNPEADLVKGENDRYVYLLGSGVGARLYYTDNFVDFTFASHGTSGSEVFLSAAGTSGGVWVLRYRVGVATYRTVISTDDLQTFSFYDTHTFDRVWAFGNTLYGSVAGTLYSSTDGSTWTSKGTPLGSVSLDIYDIAYDGVSTFLIVGELGYAMTTTNFSTYSALTGYSFTGHALLSALYVENTLLFVEPPTPDTGTIQGTLRLDTSTGSFAERTVYLYNYDTGAKIAETTSNELTGVWEFTAVAPGDYFVVGVSNNTDLTIPRDFDALGVITVS